MSNAPTFTDKEIAALAKRLKQSFRPGSRIATWIRHNSDSITRIKVDEGWTWEAFAAAMTKAGIVYQTGNPWSAKNLRLQVLAGRKAIKKAREAAIAAASQQPEPLAVIKQPALESRPYSLGGITHGPTASAEALPPVSTEPPLGTAATKPPGLHRVRTPVTRKIYEPPPPLSAEEQAAHDKFVEQTRKAMRGEK